MVTFQFVLFCYYYGFKMLDLLQQNRDQGLKLATEINQIKTNVDDLQIQLNKLKSEREAQGKFLMVISSNFFFDLLNL